MSGRYPMQQVLDLTLILMLLAGCSGAPPEPASTPTPGPPMDTPSEPVTDAPTPPPPTDPPPPSVVDAPTPTPVPTAIPASDTPFSVGVFQLQITSVKLGAGMFAPVGMAKGDTVLSVEVKVLSGDPGTVAKTAGDFDVWTTDDSERRNSSRAATATANADREILAVKWIFGVAKSSESYYLHFPGGVTVDLSPLL